MRQLGIGLSGGRSINPALLFASSEQGVWYDPSDYSTMFQDSAGTTPVTAVEQPVGKILDKSGRGNHATQATSTKRPVLSARVNLLTKTEDFSDAAWSKINATVAANATTAPDGTTTADSLIWASSINPQVTAVSAGTIVAGTALKYSCSIKAGTKSSSMLILFLDGSNFVTVPYNLTNGTAGTPTVAGTRFTSVTTSVVDQGNGWYRCSISCSTNTLTSVYAWLRSDAAIGTGDNIYLWGASLVPADQASLPYQRVNTTTDYDTVGFKPYLKFDGVDDALATASIDFTATDKMTVSAGVRKLSEGSYPLIVEISTNWGLNNGTFNLSQGSANGYAFASKGTTGVVFIVTTPNSPVTNVLSGVSSISTPSAVLRINGSQVAQNTTSQGTGNYGNYPLYIGSRAGTSAPFNGHLYSLIIRGAQSTDAQIVSAETYVAAKTGVSL